MSNLKLRAVVKTGSGWKCGAKLASDPADGEVEGAGGEERVGRLGENAAEEAAASD